MTSLCKRLALVMSVIMLVSVCGCSSKKEPVEHTPDEANKFLTDFFSDYNEMNTYLKRSDIAVSAFALDGAGLSALLRALYQSQSVTYAFSTPVSQGEGVFTSDVTVFSIDMVPLFTMYDIDREIAQLSGDPLDGDFVAQTLYSNITDGNNTVITTSVTVTLRVADDGTWSVESNNALAFAIFPNIQQV